MKKCAPCDCLLLPVPLKDTTEYDGSNFHDLKTLQPVLISSQQSGNFSDPTQNFAIHPEE